MIFCQPKVVISLLTFYPVICPQPITDNSLFLYPKFLKYLFPVSVLTLFNTFPLNKIIHKFFSCFLIPKAFTLNAIFLY